MKANKHFPFLFALIVLLNFSLRSQNTFDLLISTGSHELITHTEEDGAGNYYLSGYKMKRYSEESCGYLVKISGEGEIISENEYCASDSAIYLGHLVRIGDTLYAFGRRHSLASNYGVLWKLMFDPDLNIIQSSIQHPNPGYFEIATGPVILNKNHFVLQGFTYPDDNSPYPDIAFIELDENLDSVRSIIDVQLYNQMSFDCIRNLETNGYKVFGKYYYEGSSPVHDEIVDYDSNFNFVSVDTLPWHLRNQFCAQVYDSASYLLAGDKFMNYPNTSKKVGFMKLDCTDSVLIQTYYGKEGDTNNYPAVSNNGDFISKDNIYLGGTPNLIAEQYPWQAEDTWIMLNLLDSNLNLKWQQFYGGDAFYHLRELRATQDGGCLMVATRYDENTQFEEYDAFILKVDSSGIITSTDDHPVIPVNQLSIYPNPANDYIVVRYPGVFGSYDKEILIYNTLGMNIKQVSASQDYDETKIDIPGWPSGQYIVVLQIQGKKVMTGKFIKQ
jgi:hypothetical protein